MQNEITIMKATAGIILGFIFTVSQHICMAQAMHPVDSLSKVAFFIKNFGVTVDGTFKGLQGEVRFDPAKPEASVFEMTLDVKTIQTGIARRDRHLRSDDYFDVEIFPKITVKGDKVTIGKEQGAYVLHAKLTIRDVTRDIEIPFKAVAKNGGYQFDGSFRVNRLDYKVGGNSISMADQATVVLQVFTK